MSILRTSEDQARNHVGVGDNGIAVVIVPAQEYGLECERRSLAYIAILLLVSFTAMVANLAKAMLIKIRKLRVPFRQILWQMGRDQNHFSSLAVDRFSRLVHQAKWGAASWRALDLFYNYHSKIKPQLNSNAESWLTRYWIGKMENRQAVTNRLKLVTVILEKAFDKYNGESEIRLLSIASGSAQAVVEAMLKSPLNVNALLLDIDATAIEKAKSLALQHGLEHKFTFVFDTAKRVDDICRSFKPHIVEMVGFLDYRPKNKATALIARIRKSLPEGGLLITCNIKKNREKPFLDWVLLWPMIYRSKEQFASLLMEGGFSPKNIEIIYEPFQIHGVGVCQKESDQE